jgi:hypothetical protein
MRLLHRTAAVSALTLVGTFWLASVVVELAGSREAIAVVKQAIAWGLLLLVPSVIAANASGMQQARARIRNGRAMPLLLARKQRRGIAVAAIGLFVLAPCALWLASRASLPAPLDRSFHVIQGLELAGGAANFVLLALNARDGLRMRKPRRVPAPPAVHAPVR